MKSRAELIKSGKVWQVYLDKTPDDILFEGIKTKCLGYIKQRFGMKQWKNGTVRLGNVICEKS